MSGTKVWSTDHWLDYVAEGSVANMNQAMFTNTYNFLQQNVAAGNATLHASYFGTGGTGFDYHDGANPSRENAWAVFKYLASASTERTYDFYVMIQWADTSSFGSGGGSPGRLSGGTQDGCGICMAVRQDGGDPWGGTTAADGTDTKSATVWVPGGSTVSVVDRGCGSPPGATVGNYVTNLENMLKYTDFSTSSGDSRSHFYGDADILCCFADFSTDHAYSSGFRLGVYTPPAGLNTATPLFAMVSLGGSVPQDGAAHGNSTGALAAGGGILGRNPASGAGILDTRYNTDYTTQQPNVQYTLDAGTPLFDVFPYEFSYGDGSEEGFLGLLDTSVLGVVRGVPSGSTTTTFDTAYLSSGTTTASDNYAIPWDGATAIGTGFTRAGTQTP